MGGKNRPDAKRGSSAVDEPRRRRVLARGGRRPRRLLAARWSQKNEYVPSATPSNPVCFSSLPAGGAAEHMTLLSTSFHFFLRSFSFCVFSPAHRTPSLNIPTGSHFCPGSARPNTTWCGSHAVFFIHEDYVLLCSGR